jgi:hypothetical protein
LAASLLRLLTRIIVLLQSPTADSKYRLRRFHGLLGKDFRNHNCIRIDAIYETPLS